MDATGFFGSLITYHKLLIGTFATYRHFLRGLPQFCALLYNLLFNTLKILSEHNQNTYNLEFVINQLSAILEWYENIRNVTKLVTQKHAINWSSKVQFCLSEWCFNNVRGPRLIVGPQIELNLGLSREQIF